MRPVPAITPRGLPHNAGIGLLDNAPVDARWCLVHATHITDAETTRLAASGAREVIVTNTLPITPEKQFDNLTVLSIAPLIAAAISAVFGDDSVNKLFPGHA